MKSYKNVITVLSLAIMDLFLLSSQTQAQFHMDMIDTSTDAARNFLLLYRKYDNIRLSGYIQPQFQWTQSKGAPSYIGGDFAPNTNNRFMLRRGRIRFDYVHFSEGREPSLHFVFQFDGTERGVFIRDFWGKVMENRFKLLSLTMGMFARPFGYELNLSSNARESPERGRMSQILMKTERDLGAMISLEPQRKSGWLHAVKVEVGLFNGQGLTATTDFDSHKDLIGRVFVKPQVLTRRISMSGGVSCLYGGLIQNTPYVYRTVSEQGTTRMKLDSAITNLGRLSPRRYYGADVQWKRKNKIGATEMRLEIIGGQQTGSATSSETPFVAFKNQEAYYVRNFLGGYAYLLQTIFNEKHQLGLKFDMYDPNTRVRGRQIGGAGSSFSPADMLYYTLGGGYVFYVTDHLKWTLWYDHVVNEKTQWPGFTSNFPDDVLTCRLQFRF